MVGTWQAVVLSLVSLLHWPGLLWNSLELLAWEGTESGNSSPIKKSFWLKDFCLCRVGTDRTAQRYSVGARRLLSYTHRLCRQIITTLVIKCQRPIIRLSSDRSDSVEDDAPLAVRHGDR
jgi:hypothetical protein